MPQTDVERWIAPFIAALERIRKLDDRATLAKLRRGLTDNCAERDIWVFAHLRGAAPHHEEPALLLASLFAMHPMAGGAGSVGAAFRRMRSDSASESLDKRFAILLDSHPDDLGSRLRRAVSLLRSKEVPVDWRQLLVDCLDWQRTGRPVQRHWARDYWAGKSSEVELAQASTPDAMTAKAGTLEGD